MVPLLAGAAQVFSSTARGEGRRKGGRRGRKTALCSLPFLEGRWDKFKASLANLISKSSVFHGIFSRLFGHVCAYIKTGFTHCLSQLMLSVERDNSEIDVTASAPTFPSYCTSFGLNSLLKETLFHWTFYTDVSLMLLQNTHDFPPQTTFLAAELGKLHQSETAKNGTPTTGRLFCRTFFLFHFINLECWVSGTILSYVPST